MELKNSRKNIIYFVGPSSGANYIISKNIKTDRNIVTVFPDSGDKYTYIYKLKDMQIINKI